MERRDKRGRKIGNNWWRNFIVESWLCAHHMWWIARENIALGYKTEERDFEERNPQPTLKQFMIHLADPERERNDIDDTGRSV